MMGEQVGRQDRLFHEFCLEDPVPDHSTFSVNRHGRFRESNLLRLVFESVVRRCMAAGLAEGQGFAVDASVIEADASRYKRVEGVERIDWTDEQLARRPVKEYLAGLDSKHSPTNPGRKPKALSPSDPAAGSRAQTVMPHSPIRVVVLLGPDW